MYIERRARYLRRSARKKEMRKARNKRIFARWKKRMERKIYGS